MPHRQAKAGSKQVRQYRPGGHQEKTESRPLAPQIETLSIPQQIALMQDPQVPDAQRQAIGRHLSQQVGNRAVQRMLQRQVESPVRTKVETPAVQGGWFDKVKKAAKTGWNKIKSSAKKVYSTAKKGSSLAWSKAKEGATRLLSQVKGATKRAWGAAKQVARNSWSGAKQIAKSVWARATGIAKQAWSKVKKGASTSWGKVKSLATRAWSKAKGVAGRLWSKAKAGASTVWQKAKGFASQAWSGAKSAFGWLSSKIVGGVQGVISRVRNVAMKVWSAAKRTAGQVWDWSKSAASQAWNRIVRWAKEAWKAIKKRFEKPKTGLAKEEAVERYAGRAKELFDKWTTLSKAERMKRLKTYINAELKAAGSYPCDVHYISFSGGTNGEFNFQTWRLDINKKLVEKANPTVDEMANLVDVIYHEARHSEQWYKIARLRAGEGRTAKQIKDELYIPAKVAQAAAAKPLKPVSIWTRMFRSRQYVERQDQSIAEAKAWYKSIYGKGRKHRDEVLNDLSNRYADYRALAEEADAWKVGGSVTAKFKELAK